MLLHHIYCKFSRKLNFKRVRFFSKARTNKFILKCAYIKMCLHTRHCDVLLLRKLHYFVWRKKTWDVKFIEILLIRLQAMLWVTFFVQIYSVDIENTWYKNSGLWTQPGMQDSSSSFTCLLNASLSHGCPW